MNIVMAMNMGGDDFIVKPFDFEVLLAKVQAILRRTYSFQNQSAVMEHRNVILNEMWVHSPPLGAQANFNRIEKHDTM